MSVIYGTSVRDRLLSGVNQLADAIEITLGPSGRLVCLEKAFGSPLVTKDGVSVAKEIELLDPWENMGCRMVKEVASKTSDDAGDGTTTAIILARSMFADACKLIAAGVTPMSIKKGMDASIETLEESIYDQSFPVFSQEDIESVATISANGDSRIGKVIADAVAKVGKDGVVNIEEGKGIDITIEATDGMQLDRGWISSDFKLDPEGDCSVLENPLIFVTDIVLSSVRPLLPTIDKIVKEGRSVLWIAPDFDGEALAVLCRNFGAKVLISQLVKAPSFGKQQIEILLDIATLTGATFITKELGMTFRDVTYESFGTAKMVKITNKTTTIVEGGGSQDDINSRMDQIKSQIAICESEFDKEKLQERLGKLLGGICSIRIGASSEIELKEIKGRMEDALYATRAALEEGLVPGGGMCLVRAAETCESSFRRKGLSLSMEEEFGFNIVLDACYKPFETILKNKGIKNPYRYLDKIIDGESDSNEFIGVDARNMEICDLKERGILDPTRVVRSALINAISVVGTMITTEAAISKSKN
jgi:chaperonin GroEL